MAGFFLSETLPDPEIYSNEQDHKWSLQTSWSLHSDSIYLLFTFIFIYGIYI